MSLKAEFRKMVDELEERFPAPPIADVFFPPFHRGGQPKDAQFMAMRLEGGATGISYLLLTDENEDEYTALQSSDFVGKGPLTWAIEFGSKDPITEMLALGAMNAICQHVMRETAFHIEPAPDPLGLLSVAEGDRLGMVGLFFGLTKAIQKAGAELVVIEKKEKLIDKSPDLPISMDPSELGSCNKVLCTGTTVMNDSLDEILSHCSPDAFVSIIGPTAGYFPDPLFARGVDVVGGRVVTNGEVLLQRLADRKRWGDATQTTCFRKDTYPGLP
jgi:uncharacterized protein (DUF4213/DUF364 family)